jgi:hypothetical protein
MTSDPFEYDDGAYVLGALGEVERRAFEQHLQTCPECRARVTQARSTANLLAGLTAEAFEAPVPEPETLLPGLLRRAERERTHRRRLIASIGAVAAASIAGLAIVLAWPGGGSPAPAPAALAMHAVQPNPISATAGLVSRQWGTEIDLHCRYTRAIDEYHPYQLVVTDKAGHRYPAGSWQLVPGKTIAFTGGTSVPRDQIKSVQITATDGTALLELDR